MEAEAITKKVRFWRWVLWLSVVLLCVTLVGMLLYHKQGMAEVKDADEVTQYIRGQELFVKLLRWGLAGALFCVWGISLSRRRLKKWRNK